MTQNSNGVIILITLLILLVPMTQNSNGVIILIALLNILVYKLQQLQEAKFTEQTNHLSLSSQKLCLRFSLRDIQRATFNFQNEFVIGQGGFGKVYKGILDFGATTVAIKRLESRSKQGSQEFLTEIEMLSKFQHSHLVSLVGYCDDCHEMILVYEYMPCGTLADHLHKRVRKGDTCSPPLSWEQRLKICIGAARGLDYLHTGTSVQHRVIHRDVKSSNILLDENMAAKISDFGLSKIGPSNKPFSTYVSTNVKGTFGYLDPYYFTTQRLTRKSDVYAFGVVLFEALCGRPAVDNSLDEEQRGLAGWAQHCFKEGLLDQIIDPSIKGKILPNSLEAFVRVAIQCLHNSPKHRPTMAEVVVGLELALALQERGTIYTLVETPITNCVEVNVNANSSKLEEQITKYNHGHMDSSMVVGNQGNLRSPMVEVENANDNQENKNCSLEEGVINDADGGHHDEQSPAKMTFTEKIGRFLFSNARMFSGHSDAKPSRNRRINNNRIANMSVVQDEGVSQEASNNKRIPNDMVVVKGEGVIQGARGRIMAPNLKKFTLAELRKATRGFRRDMRLGGGGCGKVYKGWVHENTYAPSELGVGMAIAVKRLHPDSMQAFEEWQTEIKFLGNYSHPNLVKLLGYCQEDEELLLVYEYMQEGSLDNHLFRIGVSLPWSVRLKILIGAGRCLAFFHEAEEQVIHDNFKTSCILLDGEFNAKLSDLGLAKMGLVNNGSHSSTCVPRTVPGTYDDLHPYAICIKRNSGYMAPECNFVCETSVKSDVYSFGVIFLELLTGRRVSDYDKRPQREQNFVNWARPCLADKRKVSRIVDPSLALANDFPKGAMLSVVSSLIHKCLDCNPTNRPSMVQALKTLETLVPSP